MLGMILKFLLVPAYMGLSRNMPVLKDAGALVGRFQGDVEKLPGYKRQIFQEIWDAHHRYEDTNYSYLTKDEQAKKLARETFRLGVIHELDEVMSEYTQVCRTVESLKETLKVDQFGGGKGKIPSMFQALFAQGSSM
jgi:hypothetical protein